MTGPLVSVLIPAYNAAPWLGQAVESALSQADVRTEVIIVDDGSTDATLEVARSFGRRGVQVVHQPNAGASRARNHALSLAQGDFIQWLDADDLLAPGKLSAQIGRAREAGGPDVLLMSAFGEFFHDPRRARRQPNALWQDADPLEFLIARFDQGLWVSPAAWLVSHELTRAAGPWDERLRLDDDGEYFTRVVARARRVAFTPDAQACYRRGVAGSLSRTTTLQASASLLLSIQLCADHLLALEDSPRTRTAMLRYAQRWVDRSDHFHPDRGDLLPRLQAWAAALGGQVTPPRPGWKYLAIQRLLGWQATRRCRAWVGAARLHAQAVLENVGTAPQTLPRGAVRPVPPGGPTS